jgi:hypothetical protein
VRNGAAGRRTAAPDLRNGGVGAETVGTENAQ